MGRIRTAVVAHAPLDALFELASGVERYPEYIPALKSLKVLERCPKGRLLRCQWHAETHFLGKKRSLVWVQQDVWDKPTHVCEVKLLSSRDVKKLNGVWRFTQVEKGVRMELNVDFQVAHPLMTPGFHSLLDNLMKANNEALLNGLKREAEQKFWEQW